MHFYRDISTEVETRTTVTWSYGFGPEGGITAAQSRVLTSVTTKYVLIVTVPTVTDVVTTSVVDLLIFTGTAANTYTELTMVKELLKPLSTKGAGGGTDKTTRHTATPTKLLTHPNSTSTSQVSNHNGLDHKQRLALETALPITLIVIWLLLSFLWHRQRRRNKVRFANASTFNAPTVSQREEVQRWWRRDFPMTGRSATGDNTGMPKKVTETEKHKRGENSARSNPQQPGEVAEMSPDTGIWVHGEASEPRCPQSPGKVDGRSDPTVKHEDQIAGEALWPF